MVVTQYDSLMSDLCSPQYGVLGWVVGVVLGRDLQHGRDGLLIHIQQMSDHLSYL